MSALIQTRDQKMAKYAASCIEKVKDGKEFKSIARSFPSLIMANGLGQALAFLNAKDKSWHKQLYQFISEWVSDKAYAQKGKDILQLIMANDSRHYTRALQEAMAISVWIKRFAEAEFKD
jgi:CRISPR-associated protein Cmr5